MSNDVGGTTHWITGKTGKSWEEDGGSPFSVYLVNREAYAAGNKENGIWVDFPTTSLTLEKVFSQIGVGPDGVGSQIAELKNRVSVIEDTMEHQMENPDYNKLNYLAETLAHLDKEDRECFCAYECILEFPDDINDALGKALLADHNNRYGGSLDRDIRSPEDIAQEYIKICSPKDDIDGAKEVWNWAKYYVDYEGLGKYLDAECGGEFINDSTAYKTPDGDVYQDIHNFEDLGKYILEQMDPDVVFEVAEKYIDNAGLGNALLRMGPYHETELTPYGAVDFELLDEALNQLEKSGKLEVPPYNVVARTADVIERENDGSAVNELSNAQFFELKNRFFYGDGMFEEDTSELVPDDCEFPEDIPDRLILEQYEGICFVPDDFGYSLEEPETYDREKEIEKALGLHDKPHEARETSSRDDYER